MKFIISSIALLLSQEAFGLVWQVGPTRPYQYCSQVAPLVQNGDTIQIDYATYVNDKQVQWNKNNLFIVGVGGRPRLQAGSIIATDSVNGKGIFVVSGANVTIENIEFINAAVISHNGAGIRQEGANILVRRCKFDGNEMGILCGNIANCKTTVEYSEFLNGGSIKDPGYQHNIYINHIDTLIFRYNFSYNAIAQGHEFKSRANYNFILYNTIANYQTIDSRNIDIPNGGTAVIMGNVIEQGLNSSNSNIIGFGKEGLNNTAPHDLWIVSNTIVNKKTTGSFIDINTGTQKLFLKNNIMAGAKTGGLMIGSAASIDSSHNIVTDIIANCGFVDAGNYNYGLLSNSIAVDAGLALSASVGGYLLQPDKTYKDTCGFENRIILNALDIGAFEYNNTLSLQNQTAIRAFTVYPNPASDFVTVSLPDQMHTVQFYNSFGVVVKEVLIVNNEATDVSDLPGGLYFVSLKNAASQTHKLLILN